MVVRMAPCTWKQPSVSVEPPPITNQTSSNQELQTSLTYVLSTSLSAYKLQVTLLPVSKIFRNLSLSLSPFLAHEVPNITQALWLWYERAIVSE